MIRDGLWPGIRPEPAYIGGTAPGNALFGAQVGAAAIRRFRPATLKLVFGLYFLYAAIRFVAGFFGIGVP